MSNISILLLFIVGVGVVAATSPAIRPEEEYWRTKLPFTSMPEGLRALEARVDGGADDVWHPDGCTPAMTYSWDAGKGQGGGKDKPPPMTSTLFTARGSVFEGAVFNLSWAPPTSLRRFLPRGLGEGLPTSVDGLPVLLSTFRVDGQSKGAQLMRESLGECHAANAAAQRRMKVTCVYTLEGMVDLAVATLGANRLDPHMPRLTRSVNSTTSVKEFTVTSIKPLGRDEFQQRSTMTCHPLPFPTALYLCHQIAGTRNYGITLASVDVKVDTFMVCHHDTAWWDPETEALAVNGLKPGDVVCHFLEEGHLLWARAVEAA